jgi:hypothetical protein
LISIKRQTAEAIKANQRRETIRNDYQHRNSNRSNQRKNFGSEKLERGATQPGKTLHIFVF